MTKDNYVVTQNNFVATQNPQSTMKDKKTLLRQRIFMLRQTQHEVEVNSVVTKTATVSTEVEREDTETYVATQ